jgi:DNA-binding XRE family transcriptional regulator/transposase-like protein
MPSNDVVRLRLIAARERLGVSPGQMAKRLMTSRRMYEQWEGGKRPTPGPVLVAAELAAGIIRQKFPQPGSIAARVLELAGGSMTINDAAQALGVTSGTVRNAVNALEARGYTIAFARGWRVRTAQRNAAIAAGVAAGKTYAELARDHGLSRQRIQQICRSANVESVRGWASAKRRRDEPAAARKRQQKNGLAE